MISIRERWNDALRWWIDRFIGACAVIFRIILIVRMKCYYRRQESLRRQYAVIGSTPVHVYDDFMRDLIKQKYEEREHGAVYACTSGSTSIPKKIIYDSRRLRRTRMVFIDAFFRRLARLRGHRTLYIFSCFDDDASLTALLLKERGLPPYLSGLQAPHRVQNHAIFRELVATYGETAVRLWVLTISNPTMIYSTNPSTIATFLNECFDNWPMSKRLIADYVQDAMDNTILRTIHKRIASNESSRRLHRIASSQATPSVTELFPALSAISCWDGGYVAPFVDQVRKYFPSQQYQFLPMYSMSTETIETIVGPAPGSCFLPMAPGVLYEFIEEGGTDSPGNLLTSDRLRPGNSYSMVVSDNYGLRRYQTEDLFYCADMIEGIPDLRFVRRRNLTYSFTGEKLTGEQLKIAFRKAQEYFPQLIEKGFLTCFPSFSAAHKLPRYRLILVQTGALKRFDGSALARFVQNRLAELNREFDMKIRSTRLGDIVYDSVPIRDFVRRISRSTDRSAWSSQFKFLPLYPKLWEAFDES